MQEAPALPETELRKAGSLVSTSSSAGMAGPDPKTQGSISPTIAYNGVPLPEASGVHLTPTLLQQLQDQPCRLRLAEKSLWNIRFIPRRGSQLLKPGDP